jgi:hypothetical protein
MNYWLLLASPDKWFGEKETKNYKVNETLLDLDEEDWRVQKRHFKDVEIGDKCVIKISKDYRSMKRRTSDDGDVVDSLESGVYAIGEICKTLDYDKDDECYRVTVRITNNLFKKNNIINSEISEKILGSDYSSFYSKKINANKFNNILALIKINEDVDIEGIENSESLEENNLENDNTLYPAEVKIQRDMFSVRELKSDYEDEMLVLAPDFQREFVWTLKQKSELIESILMGIPLPMIYFFEGDNGVLQVVDGKQRLTTLFQFLANEFPLSQSLSILVDHKGKRYKDLFPAERAKIARHQFVTQTIIPPTPDRIKFDIFERVNRKGSTLNNQEMRNALYQGKATDLLDKLAQLESFKIATDYGISPTRMKDRYMILRFIAFYLWKEKLLIDKDKNIIDYKSDIDEFVGKTMSFINKQNEDFIEKLSNMFDETLKFAFKLRGKYVFRIPSEVKKRPINMALMDSLGYLFSKIRDCNNTEKYSDLIDNLFNDEDYIKSLTLRVDNKASVQTRFDKIEQILKEM